MSRRDRRGNRGRGVAGEALRGTAGAIREVASQARNDGRSGPVAQEPEQAAGASRGSRGVSVGSLARREGFVVPDGGLRRWDGARTTRLNEGHWALCKTGGINRHLEQNLVTLRDRCAYEHANNGMVAGMVERWQTAVVGKRGPQLQVQFAPGDWGEKLEQIFWEWSQRPEVTGRLSFVDVLNQWLHSLWINGEFLALYTNERESAENPLTLRLQSLDPRRLDVASSAAVDAGNALFMGIELTPVGRPVRYHLSNSIDGVGSGGMGVAQAVPASNVLHGFRAVEVEQLRGVPMLAAVLTDIADLRDYDLQVMDAARAAADFAVYMFCRDHQGQIDVQPPEVIDLFRRSQVTLPPGYEVASVKADQPSMNYVEFRRERAREIGSPVGMPVHRVLGDSSKHNYSSARLDDMAFYQVVAKHQGWLETAGLNPVVRQVIREAQLKQLLPMLPADVMRKIVLKWTWTGMPYVDPVKESAAEAQRLANGTATFGQVCADRGLDWELQLQELAREREAFAGVDMVHPMDRVVAGAPAQGEEEEAGDDSRGGAEGAEKKEE